MKKTYKEIEDFLKERYPSYIWYVYTFPDRDCMGIKVGLMDKVWNSVDINCALVLHTMEVDKCWDEWGHNSYLEAAIQDMVVAMEALERWSN